MSRRKIKSTGCLTFLLAIFGLAFAGCKKDAPAGSAALFHGINVDWTKLDTEFATAAPEMQESLTQLKRFFRYSQLPQALVELDKLSNNPNLTEPQKTRITDLITQTRQELSKAAPLPGQ